MKIKLAGFAWCALAVALLAGCARERTAIHLQKGESVVCIGEDPAMLAWRPARNQPVRVRSSYLPDAAATNYVEGHDFIIDYLTGSIRRAPGSRIPNYRANQLYGRENFDHSQFPGFGNNGFFAYIDYTYKDMERWPVQPSQIQYLRRTRDKLKKGQEVRIVAFGDSITVGYDVANPNLVFWRRWADDLRGKYLRARVTTINAATGGDTTTMGLQRLKAKVIEQQPDLVLIGFGMNDNNKGGVPIPQFEANLKEIISCLRVETGAEIVLYSAFPPNPKWKFGSSHMADYAAATRKVAGAESCAYADVFNNWQAVAARKKPEDLLANDVNHPNEFGHWIYYRILSELGL